MVVDKEVLQLIKKDGKKWTLLNILFIRLKKALDMSCYNLFIEIIIWSFKMFKFPFGFGFVLHYEHVKYMCMKEVPCMFC